VSFFRELGVDVGFYVPNRLTEGYGLNEVAVRQLAGAGTRVVITVDCGSADTQELALANALGLDVVVCDHHQLTGDRPPAFAVLNPHQSDCEFPFKGLSGVGVAFYLLMGLRMELRERGVGPLPDLRRYLDLVTLGTVGDVMPLRDENRVFVKYGLQELGRTNRPGIVALREMSEGSISVRTVAFRFAPLINAGGRLSDARVAVELLTASDLEDARARAALLDAENRERQALQRRMIGEAIAMVEDEGMWQRRASIVVGSPSWHPGVVGIVAARLAEKYYRPTFVMSLGERVVRGSGRSIPGVDLVEAVRECGASLVSYGGHRAAAGVSLRRAEVGSFTLGLERSVRARTRGDDFVPQLDVDGEIQLSELTPELVEDLGVLEPTGSENPAPVLVSRGVHVVSRRDVGVPDERDEKGRPPHMKLLLRQDGVSLEAIGFRMSGLPVNARERIDLAFSPECSEWGGRRRLELKMLDFRPAG
jgi:single-stranded-DNA-specific exonuclease